MFEDTFLTRPPTPVPFSCGFPRKHSKFMLCIPPPSSAAPSSSTPQFHQPQPSSSHPEPAQLSSAQSPSEDASLATSPPPSSSMYKECLKSLQESQDFSSLYDMVVEASKKHKAGPEFLTEQFVSSAIDLGEDDFQFFQTCSEEVLSAELFLQGWSFQKLSAISLNKMSRKSICLLADVLLKETLKKLFSFLEAEDFSLLCQLTSPANPTIRKCYLKLKGVDESDHETSSQSCSVIQAEPALDLFESDGSLASLKHQLISDLFPESPQIFPQDELKLFSTPFRSPSTHLFLSDSQSCLQDLSHLDLESTPFFSHSSTDSAKSESQQITPISFSTEARIFETGSKFCSFSPLDPLDDPASPSCGPNSTEASEPLDADFHPLDPSTLPNSQKRKRCIPPFNDSSPDQPNNSSLDSTFEAPEFVNQHPTNPALNRLKTRVIPVLNPRKRLLMI